MNSVVKRLSNEMKQQLPNKKHLEALPESQNAVFESTLNEDSLRFLQLPPKQAFDFLMCLPSTAMYSIKP